MANETDWALNPEAAVASLRTRPAIVETDDLANGDTVVKMTLGKNAVTVVFPSMGRLSDADVRVFGANGKPRAVSVRIAVALRTVAADAF